MGFPESDCVHAAAACGGEAEMGAEMLASGWRPPTGIFTSVARCVRCACLGVAVAVGGGTQQSLTRHGSRCVPGEQQCVALQLPAKLVRPAPFCHD